MIFSLFIFKDNTWQTLDLPSDFGLSLIQNSGFVGKIQSGSFSFSSNIPPTQNNCRILQNAQSPQMVVDRKIQLPAKLLYGSTEYYSWYFVLRTAHDTMGYKYDLIQTPGNQSKKFYDLKLWQLDFGKLELASTPKQSNIWAINLYGISKLFQYFISDTPVYFEIWINERFIVSPPIGLAINADVNNYFYIEKDPENRFIAATKNITDYSIILDVPARGRGSINVIAKNIAITSAKVKIYQYSRLSSIIRGPFVAEYNFENLTYNDVNSSINDISTNQQIYPFKFLTYFNDAFYPADNTQYEGIVNQYSNESNTLKLNDGTILNLNTYPISPCFSLIFVIEKVAEMMGFTLDAPIFKDKVASGDYYLGDLHFVNNVDFAEQLVGTTIPCNTYGTTIIYGNFMPDLTVKEFIDAIRSLCLSVEYDFAGKKMFISPCKSVLKSFDVIDISDKLTRIPSAEIIDKTYYQLSFKGGDNNIISQHDYPTEQSIADDGRDYTKIEVGFTPVLNNFDLDPFLVQDYNPNIPTVNDSARTVIYPDQKNNHPSPKICFYIGLGNNGISYVSQSNNQNGKICLSFENQGNLKGLLELFYQEYLEFLNKTTLWSADIWLSELELASFKFAQKYYAYGTVFLVESLNPKLPITDKTKIKLLSL